MADPQMPKEFFDNYNRLDQDENTRFDKDPTSRMESIRTLELLDRYLPGAPARILDVGGGPGFYARRLTKEGYEVHLVDPVLRHIHTASLDTEDGPAPASATIGDARCLKQHPDASFAAVLLLGPLYHLTSKADRMMALAEARRVLIPGGVILAAGITRFVSSCQGLAYAYVDDPRFLEIMFRDLAEGQHRNPTDNFSYFTTAYLHRPDELRDEMAEAGFVDPKVFAVEGMSWVAPDLEQRLADPKKRDVVLEIIRRTEREPSILGASPHLLGVGHRPAQSDMTQQKMKKSRRKLDQSTCLL